MTVADFENIANKYHILIGIEIAHLRSSVDIYVFRPQYGRIKNILEEYRPITVLFNYMIVPDQIINTQLFLEKHKEFY